jgi:hypothetical protein
VAENEIDLTAKFDTSEATKSVKEFGREATKSVDGINDSVDELKKSVDKTSRTKINLDTSPANKALALLKTGVMAAGAAIVATFTVGALKSFFDSVIDEAIDAENSLNMLNAALQRSGTYSADSSRAMQDFASAMMSVSTIDDDVIVGQLAIARNFAKTDEQARSLVAAAMDLAAATGMSLDQAVEQLGRTLDGTAGRLNETVPALRGVSEEALKAGDAIEIVGDQFAGAAASKLNTFQGAIEYAKNAFGNYQAEVGFVITQNTVLIAAIKEAAKAFGNAGEEIGDNRSAITSLINNGLLNLISVLRMTLPVLSLFDYTWELIKWSADLVYKSIRNLIDVFKILYESVSAVSMLFVGFTGEFENSADKIKSTFSGIIKRTDELSNSFSEVVKPDIFGRLNELDKALERIQKSADIKPIKIETELKVPDKKDWDKIQEDAPIVAVPVEKKEEKSKESDETKRQNELFEKFISDLAAIPAKFIGSAGNGAAGAQQAVPGVLADLSSTLGQGLGTVLGGPIGSAIGSGIGSALGEMIKLSSGDKNEIKAKLDEFFNEIPKVLENIVNNLPMIAERVMGELPNVMIKLMEAIPAIIMAFANAMDELAESLVMNSPALIQLMLELPIIIIKAATVAAINIAKGIGTGVARLIKEKLAEASRVVFEKLDEAVERIAQFFNGITDFFKSLSFAELGAGLKSAVTGLFDGIKTFFKDAKDLFSLKLDFDFGAIFDKLKDGVGSLFSVENIEKLIDAIIEGFNSLFDKLKIDSNKLKVGGSTGSVLQSWGREISSWTGGRAAKGGIVPSGFPNDNYPAMLTSNEVVIPAATTPNLFSLIDSLASGDQPGSNSQTNDILKQILIVLANQERTIEVKLERDTLAKAIVSLNKDNRRLA